MQIEIRHNPGFALARIHLDASEQVLAESGAMAATSLGVNVEATMQGGLGRALKRSLLGGESLFVTTFTAHPQVAGWVDVAARLPGDATVLDVSPQRSWVVTRGSWLANAVGVTMDTRWGGAQNFFGGEGGFVLRATGTGEVVVACYGALEAHELPDGGGMTVDSGHVVAYQDTVRSQLRRVSRGLMASVTSGEGLVFDFYGPGTVLTQTRNPTEFIGWIAGMLPGNRG